MSSSSKDFPKDSKKQTNSFNYSSSLLNNILVSLNLQNNKYIILNIIVKDEKIEIFCMFVPDLQGGNTANKAYEMTQAELRKL